MIKRSAVGKGWTLERLVGRIWMGMQLGGRDEKWGA